MLLKQFQIIENLLHCRFFHSGIFSLGLFHGGDQIENQHPSFTRKSQWTQLDTQCDTKCPKK